MQPNYLELLYLSSTPGLLSLTSGGRKNKITELDNRRLPLRYLCHAKVERGKQ